MIKELQIFRAKYPQYEDVSDIVLSVKLAKQYPDSYGDLPSKVNSEPIESKMEEQGFFGKIFNVPGAAIRSAILGKGYTAGAMNPGDVPRFQDMAIRKAQFTSSPIANVMLGSTPSAVGLIADMATNPADVLLAIAGKTPTGGGIDLGTRIASSKAGQAIGAIVNKEITPIKWLKSVINGPKQVELASKATIQEIKATTSGEISALKSSATKLKKNRTILDTKTKHINSIEEKNLSIALANAENKATRTISKTADIESEAIRGKLPKLFKEKSAEYGNKLNKLIGDNPVQVEASELKPVLESSLIDQGILQYGKDGLYVARTPIVTEEIQAMEMYRNIANNPTATMDIADLIKTERMIRPNFGKAWTTADHFKAQLSEELSMIAKNKIPGLDKLRSDFAPFLKWKKESIKVFKPFETYGRNNQGIGIINKIAEGKKDLTIQEAKFIRDTEKFVNRNLTDKIRELQRVKSNIKTRRQNLPIDKAERDFMVEQATKSFKDKIDSEIALKIDELRSSESLNIFNEEKSTIELIDKLKKQRNIAGIGILGTSAVLFPTIKKYIIHKLKYALTGIAIH